MLEVPAILLTCVAIFGYVNGRYLKLPLTVGLVLIALISAMLVASIDSFAPDAGITNKLKVWLEGIDFNRTLMEGMLSFLLFAGALHVNLKDLIDSKLHVATLASLGVMISTLINGLGFYWLTQLFGIHIDFLVCILFGVIVSAIIGTIVGSLCAQHKYSRKFIIAICDILQTFPSFVYLFPVMMLFGVTDTSVLIAVIIYATIPATRYTVEGLRSVPPALHDAGSMSGVTRLQRLFKIEYPLAFPHIMLGINQTVVFALFMVIIGAMIGTEDLGQYILKALSDLKGGGKGLILGLCVAFIGLAVDNLIRTWAEKRKKLLGIS